jgi:hypothetical protein
VAGYAASLAEAKMTFDDLKLMIDEAKWFERLGEPGLDGRFVQIASLAPWANVPSGDEGLERIADEMEWLPSSRNQDDPIHGRSLEELAAQISKKQEISRQSLEILEATLSALRRFKGHPALKAGPHDFTEAARGAALFASRRATYEVALGKPDFWCCLMQLYHFGHWPCGVLPGGQVVVL